MGTRFSEVYNRFLGKITDDMYIELTPKDTIRDLQILLIDAIPGFEFPRVVLEDYVIEVAEVAEEDVQPEDFATGRSEDDTLVVVDRSYFSSTLSPEEQNILALLMMGAWVQRQVTSIENTRMKYSGNDFKLTSQAAHLGKLLTLLTETQRQSFHMQRLYKRRKVDAGTGKVSSNWSALREVSALDD